VSTNIIKIFEKNKYKSEGYVYLIKDKIILVTTVYILNFVVSKDSL